MRRERWGVMFGFVLVCWMAGQGPLWAQEAVLPQGVKAVWDMDKAQHVVTPTREQICINGLWRWQPVTEATETVPEANWGYFKVPGPWPKMKGGRDAEAQAVYAHESWRRADLEKTDQAWYQREVVVPATWAGRRIVLETQYVNNSAVVYLDGKKAGEITERGGTVDLTALCVPGQKQVLSMFVRKGQRHFRGLCGDVYLEGTSKGERIDDVKVETSVRKWEITVDAAVTSLTAGKRYQLVGDLLDGGKVVNTIRSEAFGANDVQGGRIRFSNPWHPGKLWDTDTPENQYDLKLRLQAADGKVLDEFRPARFGFREIWIDGRDIRLNGTKVHFFATALDLGEGSAYSAS